MSLTRIDAHEAQLEDLDASLRDAVRREALDPQRDPAAVRRLAARLVAEHDERSLTGAVLPLPDAGTAVDELVARISGFGPLQRYLDDSEVEEFRS